MNRSKVVGQRKARTPAEFQALGARLDQELSVVRPFTRNAVLFSKRALGTNWRSGSHSDY